MTQVSHLSSETARLVKRSRLGRALAFQEGQGGGTAMKFMQDTGSAWLPKILISRSKAEGAEVSFLEFGESAMTYALPMFLGPGLANSLFKLLGKNKGFEKHLLTQTYDELRKTGDQAAASKAMTAKAAIILSTIGGIGLWGESLVNYGKNLMTAKVFKKDKFSDVINLGQGQQQPANFDDSPQVRKSKKRIKQATAAFGGLLGSAFLLAKFGHRSDAIKALSDKVVRHLDFDFARSIQEKATYGLGNRKGLLGAIMLTCSLPYLDSARDGYERLETALRLPLVFAYILYGQEIIQKGMIKGFPGLFESVLDNSNKVMTVQEIAEAALKKAANGSHTMTDTMRTQAASEMQRGLLTKGLTIAAPLASGILITGLGLGLLNRFITAYRFKKHHNKVEQADFTSPAGQSPFMPGQFNSMPAPNFQPPKPLVAGINAFSHFNAPSAAQGNGRMTPTASPLTPGFSGLAGEPKKQEFRRLYRE